MSHLFRTIVQSMTGATGDRRRLIGVALGLVLALLLGIGLAIAAPSSGYFIGADPAGPIVGTLGGSSASYTGGTMKFDVYPKDGLNIVPTFCTDLRNTVSSGDYYLYSGLLSNCKLVYMMRHFPPRLPGYTPWPDRAGALSVINDEMAARQSAVWSYSDGWVPSTPWAPKPRPTNCATTYSGNQANRIACRAWEIIDTINSLSDTCTIDNPSLTITPASATNALGTYQDFVVELKQGISPVAGKVLTVTLQAAGQGTLDNLNGNTSPSSINVTTGAAGTASFRLWSPAGTTDVTSNIKVTAPGMTYPAGAVYIRDTTTPGQKLILGDELVADAEASAQVLWTKGRLVIHKFEDKNLNGVQDPGEDNLANWTFTVRTPNGTVGGPYTTDSNGNISRSLSATNWGIGTYLITETLKIGWQNTTPLTRTVQVTDINGTYEVVFGNVRLPVVVMGKCEDVNGNGLCDWVDDLPGGTVGVYDFGDTILEPRLSEWYLQLYDAYMATRPGYGGPTGSNGLWIVNNDGSIDYLVAGRTYHSVETLKSGWVNSTGSLTITIGSLPPGPSGYWHPNYRPASIKACKWHDLDGNGVRAAGEPAIPDWKLYLTQNGWTAPQERTTDSSGCAVFSGLRPGTYKVYEEQRAGWVRTAPAAANERFVTVVSGDVEKYVDTNGQPVDFGNQQQGKIIVDKVTDPAGDLTAFSFTLSGPGGVNQSFSLTDTQAPYDSGWVAPGSYSVAETVPPGWTLVGAACSDDDNAYEPNSITVGAGKEVRCTFTNAKETGRLKVLKYNDLNGSGEQDNGETGLSGWSIIVKDSQDNQVASGTTGTDGWVSFNLPPGTYTVCEILQTGWQNTDPTDGSLCKTVTVGSGGSSPGPTETILTIPNKAVFKVAFEGVSNNGLTWTYRVTEVSGSDLSHWVLGLCAKPTSVTPGVGGDIEEVSFGLDPTTGVYGQKWDTKDSFSSGVFTLTFNQVYAIGSTQVAAKDGKSPTTGQMTALGTIAGPDCSATPPTEVKLGNRQKGKIIVKKVTEPTGSQVEFNFTASYTDPFTLKDGGENDSGWLVPGVYTVEETVPAGWDLTKVTCTDADGNSVTYGEQGKVTLAAGDVITCVFENTQRGKIIVEKQTDPDGAEQAFNFTASYNAEGFSLSDGDTNDSGWLVPGVYTVEETVLAGWDLTKVTCTDADGNSVTYGEQGKVTLAAGDVITCVFENTQRGKIIVEKQTDPDGAEQAFNFTASYNAEGFSLSDGEQNDSGWLEPGNYSVTETVPDGWELTRVDCGEMQPAFISDQGPENPKQIDLQPGETIYCTFYNTQQSRIIVDKVTVPSGDPTDFNFTLSGDGIEQTFDLSDTSEPYDSGFLSPGSYDVTETANNAYTTTVECTLQTEENGGDDELAAREMWIPSEVVELGAGEVWLCTFTNYLKLGELTVTKVVDWQGADPDSSKTFRICIQGPSFPDGDEPGACRDFTYAVNGDTYTWLDLIPGDYTVTETPPGVEWKVEGSGVIVNVPAGCDSIGPVEVGEDAPQPDFCPAVTVTNTLQQGSLRVTKIVEWNGVPEDRGQDFTICITGPSFPAPNGGCQTLTDKPAGGVITWTNLIPGPYIVTENDPAPAGAWSKVISPESVIVPANGLGQATVTNSRKAPQLTLDKAIVPAPDGEARATNGEITFTIRITNTGPTALKVVPLTDVFTGPVEFVRSQPAHTSATGNTVTWDDLVPKFGGTPLAPGASFLVQVVFRVTATTEKFDMDNTAIVQGAKDIYDTPANRAEDTEQLRGGFTYVDLLYFTATPISGGVRLDWATATEFNNAGFYILRSTTGQLSDAVRLPIFIPGTGRGTHGGATYAHTDTDVQPGQLYTYWLVDVDLDGTETIHPETAAVTVSGGGNTRLFLPVVSRSR